jgi:hypothetical protein
MNRALQAAEKLRMGGEKADFEGYKTINPTSRIVPRASQLDPFFALCGKLSFSAACLAPETLKKHAPQCEEKLSFVSGPDFTACKKCRSKYPPAEPEALRLLAPQRA